MNGVRYVELRINGGNHQVPVSARDTLLDVLRGPLELTGSKRGCNQGQCGTCTVIVDGRVARSCLMLAFSAVGREITTVEGLAPDGELSAVQRAFVEEGAVQCGFCMPGMVVAATALLVDKPHPTTEEIRRGLSGNLCRCSGYVKAVEAVRHVGRDGGMT